MQTSSHGQANMFLSWHRNRASVFQAGLQECFERASACRRFAYHCVCFRNQQWAPLIDEVRLSAAKHCTTCWRAAPVCIISRKSGCECLAVLPWCLLNRLFTLYTATCSPCVSNRRARSGTCRRMPSYIGWLAWGIILTASHRKTL